MKITNNPSAFASAQWPDMRRLDNDNVIYCGELQARYRYHPEPGPYSLYMTEDGAKYVKVTSGQVLIPSFSSLIGAPRYRIHLVLVRNNIQYDIEDRFCRYCKDENDLYYNERSDIHAKVRVGNVSRYISYIISNESDTLTLVKNELAGLCKSLKTYDPRWRDQFTKHIKRYGLKCCYLQSDKPVHCYSSLPENFKEHNRKVSEKASAVHDAEVEKVKVKAFLDLSMLLPEITPEDIIKLQLILSRDPKALAKLFKGLLLNTDFDD